MNEWIDTLVSLSKASAESVFSLAINKYHVWSGCILGRCSSKVYLRDHIICISESSQTSFIFCIQALEIHTFFWKYFYPLEEMRCVGLLALFVWLGIWWWLKSALLLEFMWYAVFSQIFILTGLQEIERAPQNNPNNTLIWGTKNLPDNILYKCLFFSNMDFPVWLKIKRGLIN